jgi:hypothetical protein
VSLLPVLLCLSHHPVERRQLIRGGQRANPLQAGSGRGHGTTSTAGSLVLLLLLLPQQLPLLALRNPGGISCCSLQHDSISRWLLCCVWLLSRCCWCDGT